MKDTELVYIYITVMKRTQIYFDEEIYNYLKRESEIRKKTISELIREAVKEKMSRRKVKILKALEEVKGIWKDREIDPTQFVEKLREDRVGW